MQLRRYYTTFLFLITIVSGYSQTTVNPNYGLKSHETLNISRVEITAEKTLVFLTIENLIEKGNFCADKNIFVINPAGARLKLLKVSGIPVCPDSYNFSTIGEKLQFTLEFPPLEPGTEWIDIVEDCTTNCFWFYGVTLDSELNKRLDEVFSMASKGKPADNIILFENILESIDNKNPGIEGLLYVNIINATSEGADTVNTRLWYERMVASKAPRLNNYIRYINNKGIK